MVTLAFSDWQWAEGISYGTALSACGQHWPRNPLGECWASFVARWLQRTYEEFVSDVWKDAEGSRRVLGCVSQQCREGFWLLLPAYPSTQLPHMKPERLRISLKTLLSLFPLLNYTSSYSQGATKEEINLPLCFAGVSAHFWVKTPTWQKKVRMNRATKIQTWSV